MSPTDLSHLSLTTPWVVCFGLLLCRAGGWVTTVPLIGAQGIASIVRSSFALILAVALTPVGLAHHPHLPANPLEFLAAGGAEFLVGAAIGWTTGLLFSAAQMAGALADSTSGLAYAAMVDPASGNQQSSFSRLFSITFMAIAFASDAHHTLLEGFASTLGPIPPGVWPGFSHDALDAILTAVMALMRAAIEIGAPLLGALFLTEVALGLVSKFYPQMNILVIGLGVKAMVAMVTTGTALMLLPAKLGPMLAFGAHTLTRVL